MISKRYLLLFILFNLCQPFVYAEEVLDLDEERCFTDVDLGEALANDRCWITVDDMIYDLTSNNWWSEGSHLGYKCGDITSLKELEGKGIRFRDLIDYYDDMRFSSRVGELGSVRSIAKPSECGDSSCGSAENFRNCPQDCPPEVKDDLCIPFFDFICDPDCNRGQDRDCICNIDSFCETEFENHSNCPTDCPPDYPDGLCYRRSDGFCDPDCGTGEDPDCVTGASTTLITTTSTVVTTPECGNGFCEEGENYFTCPRDCPSGGRDGVCDEIVDRLCDPDCGTEQDPDCVKTPETTSTALTTTQLPQESKDPIDYLPYLAVLFIVIIIVFLTRRKLEDSKIEKEKEEFRRWKEEGGGD